MGPKIPKLEECGVTYYDSVLVVGFLIAFSSSWSDTQLQYPPLWARLLMQKSKFSVWFSLLLLAGPGGPKILAWTILRQDVYRSVLMGMAASATVPLLTILRTLGPGPGGSS